MDNESYDYGYMAGMQATYDRLATEGADACFPESDSIRDALQELDSPFRVQYYHEEGDRSVGIPDVSYFLVIPNPNMVVCLTRQEAGLIRQHLSRVPMDPEERTNLYAALGRP